jgi:hypothetical protein
MLPQAKILEDFNLKLPLIVKGKNVIFMFQQFFFMSDKVHDHHDHSLKADEG